MARPPDRPTVRPDGQLLIRTYADKSKKLTVSVPPALADKLRLAAVGLGCDQGDLVAAGLEWVLKGVEVRVRVLAPVGSAEGGPSSASEGEGLRVAG